MNKPLILVVEDDAAVRNLITTTLETHQYRAQVAPNGEAGIVEAISHNPDVILLDLGLPEMCLRDRHLRVNLQVGNEVPTILDALTQCLPYVGFPRTLNALACLHEAKEK